MDRYLPCFFSISRLDSNTLESLKVIQVLNENGKRPWPIYRQEPQGRGQDGTSCDLSEIWGCLVDPWRPFRGALSDWPLCFVFGVVLNTAVTSLWIFRTTCMLIFCGCYWLSIDCGSLWKPGYPFFSCNLALGLIANVLCVNVLCYSRKCRLF